MTLQQRIERAREALRHREAIIARTRDAGCAAIDGRSGDPTAPIAVDTQWNNFNNYFHNWDNFNNWHN